MKAEIMTPLQRKLIKHEQTLSGVARDIGVSLQDLSHFVRGESDKVGRVRRKMIKNWMVGQGYMKPRRKLEYLICPHCGARHMKRKNEPQQLVALAPEGQGNR